MLTGIAPDGSAVGIAGTQEGNCEARSDEFICNQLTEDHGPWHIAHTGAEIVEVWPA